MGWRTALLFDELGDLLQNGALRVAALVQLVTLEQTSAGETSSLPGVEPGVQCLDLNLFHLQLPLNAPGKSSVSPGIVGCELLLILIGKPNLRLMAFEGNKLCAYRNECGLAIRMWVLEEDEEIEGEEEIEGDEENEEDEEWTKLMSIPINQSRLLPQRNFAPLAFMRDGRVLLCKNDNSRIEDCLLYNPKNDPNDCRLYNDVDTEKLKQDLGFEGWHYKQVTYEESIESLDRYKEIQRGERENMLSIETRIGEENGPCRQSISEPYIQATNFNSNV
ncbi:hypothetical protein FNV43_RR00876 [Rhamnella rubrinervis]|uniref:Uncharacterized protein n=1 Tax=Rhamnella rubrinervis TaxID=2594499 RepID=A0A8K0HNL2_9ROSA|nr:hypothetical protein FNV43_RR00876 [Rhamnella rubrinervis]